ncbi:hypothetical protein BH11CYA1_BH11CYA1_21560 [soil metagenome]
MTDQTQNEQLKDLEVARNRLAEQIRNSQRALADLDERIVALKQEFQQVNSTALKPEQQRAD